MALIVALVVDEGFEPSKAEPADLQSAPIGRSGNLPLSGVRLSGFRIREKSAKLRINLWLFRRLFRDHQLQASYRYFEDVSS